MPAYQDTLKQLYETLRPFAKQGQALDEDTELMSDLGLDSMQVMQLLQEIEDRFDVSIPLNILPEVRTVKDLAQQLESLTQQTP